MPRGRVRIGISGWLYPPWRGVFYPKDLAQKRELAYASRKFESIEINGTFYSLKTPASFQRWYRETPEDFVFSIKGSRYITHIRRLREIEQPLTRFVRQGLSRLREKLGPLLWQFPPNMKYDADRFERFFKLLRKRKQTRDLRHAVEVRNDSFDDPSFLRLLRKYNIAFVIAETAGKWLYREYVTADFVYIRLHGDEVLYVSGYTETALRRWATKIRAWRRSRDVYCYFDNDAKLKAPRDAQALARKLAQR